MTELTITELARVIKAELPTALCKSCFTGASTDSRTTRPGDCFFALSGPNFDGSDFLADAFERGACCAVVGKEVVTAQFPDKIILQVDDTIEALGRLAAAYRCGAAFKVIAITGSVGKTTTRRIVAHVLSRHFRCSESPRNFNNNIGLPLTLLGAEPQDQIVIAELGSNAPGEIANLTSIARPDIAVVTNVHPAHLAGFGDIETIVREKLSISEGLSGDGRLLINGDIAQLTSYCRAKGVDFTTFGKTNYCDIQAENIIYRGVASEFTIDGTCVYLPLPGPGNVENALAAWAVCSRLGITINDFTDAVKSLLAVDMRAELLYIGTLTVLNDCYNANPASTKNALDILANLGAERAGRLVFICGDMAELGHQAEVLHGELGIAIAQAKVQLVLTVGDLAALAARAAKKTAIYDLRIKCFKDTDSACNNLQKFIKNDDIILIKGSRVARLERAAEKLTELFSRPAVD